MPLTGVMNLAFKASALELVLSKTLTAPPLKVIVPGVLERLVKPDPRDATDPGAKIPLFKTTPPVKVLVALTTESPVPAIVKTRAPPTASVITALIVAVTAFPGDELKDVAAILPVDTESIIDPAVIVTLAYVGE